MLILCGNPACRVRYADSMRACPVCATAKPDRPIAAEPNPGVQARRRRIGFVFLVFACLSFLGLVGSAIAANVFAIAIGVVMTFVWGRLAWTSFQRDATK